MGMGSGRSVAPPAPMMGKYARYCTTSTGPHTQIHISASVFDGHMMGFNVSIEAPSAGVHKVWQEEMIQPVPEHKMISTIHASLQGHVKAVKNMIKVAKRGNSNIMANWSQK